jgi:tetratricopeptide (TPR) repeat protein
MPLHSESIIRLRLPRFALALMLPLLAIAGCQSQQPNHQGQARADALKQWNDARASVLEGLAREQYENGNLDKCRVTVDEALQLAPDNASLHILSAKLSIEQSQLELAERELALARKCDPKDAEADYLSGVVFQRWQQPQSAYEFYTSASEKAPAELAYLLARAEMLVQLDRRDEALTLLNQKVIYFEHSAVIRDAVGELLVQAGRYPEACEMLRQASILANDDSQIREHLAFAQYYAGDFRAASDGLRRLLADPDYANRAEILVTLGQCDLALTHVALARSDFESAAQISPNNVPAWLGLAKTALQANDLRRAELSIQKILAIDPDSADGHLLYGYLRLRQNRLNDAMQAFRHAEGGGSDPEILCMIGFCFERAGRPEQAARYYTQALRLKPQDEMANKLMASLDATK